MNSRQLHRLVPEYANVLARAMREGWLAPLVSAHLTPMSVDGARNLLNDLGELPVDLQLRFPKDRVRGRARYRVREKRYGITLPREMGPRSCHLRVGLVLHEAAHVYDHLNRKRFGHGPEFCDELRRLLAEHWTGSWRESLMTSSYREIYDRHRGPYSLHVVRELTGGKGKPSNASDHLEGPYAAEEAHEEARLLVKQKNDVVEVFVFSITEGQFIGAFYKRGEEHRPWHEEVEGGRMELPDQRQAPALVPERSEPVRPVDDPGDDRVPAGTVPADRPLRVVPTEKAPRSRKPRSEQPPGSPKLRRVDPTKLPGDRFRAVRGRALQLDLGNAERWPKSKPAQVVRAFFEEAAEAGPRRATPAEVVQTLGPKLKEMGVGFPASLVSRLKQAGLLREVDE